MALDVYFKEDVLGALRNTARAHGPMGEEAARVLEAVGLSFHIDPQAIGIERAGVTYDTFGGPVQVSFLPPRLSDGRYRAGG